MSQTSFEKWKFAGGLPEVLVVNGPYPLIPMGAGLPPLRAVRHRRRRSGSQHPCRFPRLHAHDHCLARVGCHKRDARIAGQQRAVGTSARAKSELLPVRGPRGTFSILQLWLLVIQNEGVAGGCPGSLRPGR